MYISIIGEEFEHSSPVSKTKKSKTVLEWIDTVGEPYKSKMLKYIKVEYLNRQKSSLRSVVLNGFTWDYTKEGEEFWRKYYKSL